MRWETAFRNFKGEWQVSQWENGRRYYTSIEDGHTYFQDAENGGGHDNCPCFNEKYKDEFE